MLLHCLPLDSPFNMTLNMNLDDPFFPLFFSPKANSIVVDHVQAESWLHRFIIGRKGKNIDNITQSLSKVRW